MSRYTLHQGDSREVLKALSENSVDAIVCDPPYGLAFMGKKWDYDVPGVDIWAECLRVLKPGGHLLAFAGTRTQHRMAVRIEDAGFEIRDMIAWVYGCLDEATEVATEKGVMPYHKTKVGDRVLCYDVAHGEYTYQPILEIVEYDYSDTAYRLVGDFGEQVVSRNHRVIAECGGSESFNLAETLGAEARVPVLESLPALQQAVRRTESKSGFAQQDLQQGVCQCADWGRKQGFDASGSAQGRDDQMRGLRNGSLEAKRLAQEDFDACLQSRVQRRSSRGRVGEPCLQGAGELEAGIGSRDEGSHDRSVEPGLEGGIDVPQSQRCVCHPADQVRSLPGVDDADGAVGRLCDGAPIIGGACDWSAADAGGVCAPHQPRRDGQPAGKSDAVRDEWTAQGVRAWGGHRSAVVRVVPFHYTGKVWCLRVPTGAFVAVRNGVAFPTGNSGFPKSLDVSKALDKASGAEREVFGVRTDGRGASPQKLNNHGKGDTGIGHADGSKQTYFETAPATDAARQWQGWGTALKPALEPITLARKPLIGTVAANVLEHGTGALNIDGCRVGEEVTVTVRNGNSGAHGRYGTDDRVFTRENPPGRWPANLIHDGSEEVVSLFPREAGAAAPVHTRNGDKFRNAYGAFAGNVDEQGSTFHGDTGSAARFFASFPSEAQCHSQQSAAPTVAQTLSLQSALAASVQSAAAIWPSLAGIVSSDWTAPSTSVTPSESRTIYELATATMGSFVSESSREQRHEKLTPCGSRVNVAATREPTGITTITASLSKSDGSAVRATFTITPTSLEVGGKDCAPSMDGKRFMYCAKASKKDRNEGCEHLEAKLAGCMNMRNDAHAQANNLTCALKQNTHPTVKPTDLMAYLCRLVTPAGGTVLDPFMGSGSTGKAAMREGFHFIGIDLSAEYIEIARARIDFALRQGHQPSLLESA